MRLSRSLPAIAAVENRERLRWAVRVRWLVIAGFLLLALVARALGRLSSIHGCVLAAVLGSSLNGLNQWSVRRWRWIGVVSVGALFGDVLLISWVVVHTGGLRSPFVMMYVVQVVATAMLVDVVVAALSALLCVGGFVGALHVRPVLEGGVGWQPAASPADLATDHLVWALFLLYCLALLVYLGGYISDQLRASERNLAAQNERLRQTIASLERTHAQLATTHERLKSTEAQLIHSEKIRALGQFVAGIAHELNNPMSFVYANLEHLGRHLGGVRELLAAYETVHLAEPDRIRLETARRVLRVDALLDDLPALLQDCEEGVRRAQEIVSGLRAFARSEREDRWQAVDLHEALEASLTLLRHRLPAGVIIERRYGSLPRVECLPGQLNQVFLNLLANAVDAVGDRGRITIQTEVLPNALEAEPARAAVTISDDGPGIDSDAVAHLFEPFFTTKEIGRGVGLGLSVSHGIIRRHGGVIRVRSAAGAAFTVVIPVRHVEATGGDGESFA